MSDTISRQAVIDALCKSECGCSNAECRHKDDADFCVTCDNVKIIKSLPSTQPKIVRCKDCRWGRETGGNIECFADINEPPEYHGYEWFCPNGERRTNERFD